MAELERMGYRFRGKVWEEESVLGESFRRNAGRILHPDPARAAPADRALDKGQKKPAPPYSQEVLAAGVARSLGEGVRGAAKKAPGILDVAKRMFPKPSGDPLIGNP